MLYGGRGRTTAENQNSVDGTLTIFVSTCWIIRYCMDGLLPDLTCVINVGICNRYCPDGSNDTRHFHVARDSNESCLSVYVALNYVSFLRLESKDCIR